MSVAEGVGLERVLLHGFPVIRTTIAVLNGFMGLGFKSPLYPYSNIVYIPWQRYLYRDFMATVYL